MPFTVQLDLDARTEAALGAVADRMARISDLETVRQIGDVHHMSLGVYGELPVDFFVPKLARFAETLRPVHVRVANLGIFPGGVLFLGLVVTAELLELHRGFHAEFAPFSSSCWEHYHPGVWVPHITMVMNAKNAALENAVTEVVEHWKPSPAKLDALRLIEFRPVRTLFHRKL
jgi:hypothetical protein